MQKKYQAVVFDLDGTLLNTLEDLKDAVNYTMSALNCPLRTLEEVRRFVGNGIKKLLERSLPETHKDAETIERAYGVFCDYYAGHDADKTVPYAGMVALIDDLRARGISLSVVSNKADFASRALCEKFFGNAFTSVIGAREDLPRKPDPAGVTTALAAMRTTKENTAYVGDSDVDYYTAKNAGLDCVLVSWGFREKALLEALKPLAVADTAEELRKILLGEGREK